VYGNVLQNPAVFLLLLRIDNELASEACQGRCRDPKCKGPLHVADFPRKPRGVPPAHEDAYSVRYSFTCGRCDLRTTPPSVRFLYRRLYVAAVVLLASPPEGASVSRLGAQLGVSRRTLLRWQQWWRQDFVRTDCWKEGRMRFTPLLVGEELPLSMLDRFDAPDPQGRLVQALHFISPVSIRPSKVVK
jgi:hypothetical protein